ncbi:hypothetical protein BJF90_37670 [Pseudonocardia sp. CNS-004]|nr:hypothetical protein BJF90_37670 [Pseudonocardia sp. CNS-004]
MAPAGSSANRNVSSSAAMPASAGAGPPNQVVASWWPHEHERGVGPVGGLEQHRVRPAQGHPPLPGAGKHVRRDHAVLTARGDEELPGRAGPGEPRAGVPAEPAEHVRDGKVDPGPDGAIRLVRIGVPAGGADPGAVAALIVVVTPVLRARAAPSGTTSEDQ